MANWSTDEIPRQSGRLAVIAGSPGVAMIAPRARDLAVAARLWDISETLTKVRRPSTQTEHLS
jgi:hypothetical protein